MVCLLWSVKEGSETWKSTAPPSSFKQETWVPACSGQKIEILSFARRWCPGSRNWGNLPSLPGGLPPWPCFRVEVFAADGGRAGETSAWGCAVHGSRSGIMPLQLVISQAFNTPLPKSSKTGVMDSTGLHFHLGWNSQFLSVTELPARLHVSTYLFYFSLTFIFDAYMASVLIHC